MLYDNALLARAYLHGWQALGHERWRTTCERTLDWTLREMRGPEGGFYSALDADSEGDEGRFYVWTPAEIREVLAAAGLGDAADEVIAYYGVSERGNFEGANILHLIGRLDARAARAPRRGPRGAVRGARPARLARARRQATRRRGTRSMIAALADAGAVLGRDDYLDAARVAAEFVWTEMRDPDGRLLRT